MKRIERVVGLVVFAVSALLAAEPSFEVVSIKPANPALDGHISSRTSISDGGLVFTNVSLRDLVRMAYAVTEYQISGPEWLGDARFDLRAKFPSRAERPELPAMLQSMLVERFHHVIERGERETAVYVLLVAKNGPKLKPVVSDDTSSNNSARS
jgi:uncharacterized protein (TIGR03435 family)